MPVPLVKVAILSRDEILRIILLLLERFGKRSDARDNGNGHERKGDKRPDHTPTLRRAAVSPRKHTRVGAIHLAQNKIVALNSRQHKHQSMDREEKTHNIPNAIKRRHDPDKKLSQ